jgi:DNA repair exonuclease SbcCD ATPase subunit
MIELQTLTWSHAFSYGADSTIDFTASPLTQLVGKNGHGKSSIALILEEVLFNKNSKGIKKGDILNRYSGAKAYSISLTFGKDGVSYRIETKRGSSQTVNLYKNDIDISSHTATQTYKQIELLIGMDHKTFAQIVYQSHAGSLEFLTAPDTARKKFLIELLNLGKYTKAGEIFKNLATELSKDVAAAQGKVDTITQWIAKYKNTDLNCLKLFDVPNTPDDLVTEKAEVEAQLANITSINKRISQNNTYRALQAKIVIPEVEKPDDCTTLEHEMIRLNQIAQAAQDLKRKIGPVHHSCPTCKQAIDSSKSVAMIAEQDAIINDASTKYSELEPRFKDFKLAKEAWSKARKAQEEWEKYHQLIDTALEPNTLDDGSLVKRIAELDVSITNARASISKIKKQNESIAEHNSKATLVAQQLSEMSSELDVWVTKLAELSARHSKLALLVKTFSTTGLVAYKIENLVKDLEGLSNEYLGELSSGRFQISFQISGSDKLNVVITDNGTDIDINALSGGERARVNIATLLAIRKLMQALSQSRMNLLILDETVEALDVEGKEKLIEVLLQEESLNTVLISHGFSHPLLEKVQVTKVNNISYIEG